ncbi:hypothetical protein RintRC_3868 [Richelia intracellularis]|nr:hypothetical protein RintRC_3868 [Richelia intracellularis]
MGCCEKTEESAEELRELPRKQKTGLGKEPIQSLYLLKIGQVKTIKDLGATLLVRPGVEVRQVLEEVEG